MAVNSPFELSRATIEDMPELVPVLHRSFPPEIIRFFTGCENEKDLPKLVEDMQKDMREDKTLIWLKVVDKSSGKIIAGSEWRVNVSHSPTKMEVWPVPWLEGTDKEISFKVHKGINDSRNAAMTGPYVYLHICFTDAKFRRRGAGNIMMQWGVDLADLLFLPAWIEASDDGNKLYKTFGFYDYENKTYEGMSFLNMKRDAKTAPLMGGK